jgi:hypothetical protein
LPAGDAAPSRRLALRLPLRAREQAQERAGGQAHAERSTRIKLRATAMATVGATPPFSLELLRPTLPCLASPCSSPSGPLGGRGPTPYAACASSAQGGHCRRHRVRATEVNWQGSSCAAAGARGGARPRPPPSRARGELLPPRRACASCSGDFLCCDYCIPMFPQCF